jgi:hypothetical protein
MVLWSPFEFLYSRLAAAVPSNAAIRNMPVRD